MWSLRRLLFRDTSVDAPQPRLFLHIGINKAGSSAIQRTLAMHDAALRAQGLLYPRTGRSDSQAHHLLSHVLGFSQGVPPAVKPRSRMRDLGPKLLKEARASGCHTLLVSSEVFTNPGDIVRVREFFSAWDTRIVVYLRRHDDWWASCYGQGVRTVADPPWGEGFESYIAYVRRSPVRGKFRRLVDGWAAVFGADRIIVRPHEESQNQPGIVADLLDAIGFPQLAASVGVGAGIHNASPGERDLAIIDAIQHADFDPSLRKRIVKAIGREPNTARGGGFVSPALRRQLVEENLDDYRYIAETYLGRADGRLFDAPLPDPAAPWIPPPEPTAREIIERMAAVLGSATRPG